MINGPSKTTRVPMIVGPSNSGKTTVVKPFDKLLGFRNVHHKPALGSSCALRNIVKDKKFLLWDDYNPVLFAQPNKNGQATVPVSTFLSLFQGQPFEVHFRKPSTTGIQILPGTVGAYSQPNP